MLNNTAISTSPYPCQASQGQDDAYGKQTVGKRMRAPANTAWTHSRNTVSQAGERGKSTEYQTVEST